MFNVYTLEVSLKQKKVSVMKRGEHGALSKIITDKKIIKVGGAYGKVSRKKNRNTREKYKA